MKANIVFFFGLCRMCLTFTTTLWLVGERLQTNRHLSSNLWESAGDQIDHKEVLGATSSLWANITQRSLEVRWSLGLCDWGPKALILLVAYQIPATFSFS